MKKNVKKTLSNGRINYDILCQVCDDYSSGKHYGIHACDGCAGFFKRTTRRQRSFSCSNKVTPNSCPISRSSRNTCRACRLKRCRAAGMNQDAVQNERGPRQATMLKRVQMAAVLNRPPTPPAPGGLRRGSTSPPASVSSTTNLVSSSTPGLPTTPPGSSWGIPSNPYASPFHTLGIPNPMFPPILNLGYPTPPHTGLPSSSTIAEYNRLLYPAHFPPSAHQPVSAFSGFQTLHSPEVLAQLYKQLLDRLPRDSVGHSSLLSHYRNSLAIPTPRYKVDPSSLGLSFPLNREILKSNVKFAKALPQFTYLTSADQESLLLLNWHRLFLASSGQFNLSAPSMERLISARPAIATELGGIQRLQQHHDLFKWLKSSFESLNLTESEYSFLKCLALFYPPSDSTSPHNSPSDVPHLATLQQPQHVSLIYSQSFTFLQGHVMEKAANWHERFSSLLLLTNTIVKVGPALAEALFFEKATEGSSVHKLVLDFSRDECSSPAAISRS